MTAADKDVLAPLEEILRLFTEDPAVRHELLAYTELHGRQLVPLFSRLLPLGGKGAPLQDRHEILLQLSDSERHTLVQFFLSFQDARNLAAMPGRVQAAGTPGAAGPLSPPRPASGGDLGSGSGPETESAAQQRSRLLQRSREAMRRYHNLHLGERCVIIGNGPSLGKMDLSFLENEICFGMNRIYLAFDQWQFRPDYYVAVNPLVIEQSAEEILKLHMPRFLSHSGIGCFESPQDIMFLGEHPEWEFSETPYAGLHEGWTVTFVAMQLAYFMGFSEVVLIGVDHHFVTPGAPNKEVVSPGDDPNHFHPGYFGKGVRWHLPDLERSEHSYRLAKEAFEKAGRRIVDATLDGKLTIFPKVGYQEYFSQGRSPQGPLLSAIVSTYNSERFMRGCLEDLTAQTLFVKGEMEIMVIDSGSPQDEAAVVREFQQKHPRIQYVRTERETLYGAWNRGIREASGKYLTNANTDDRHRPDALEILCQALESNPGIDLVYGDCYVTATPNETFAQNDKARVYRYPDFSPPDSLLHYQFGPQPVWRRSVHDRIGCFDPSFKAAGDYDFNIRFALSCQALHLPLALGLYLEHREALSFQDDRAVQENHAIKERYRTQEQVERLYAQAGFACSKAEEKVRIHLDMGIKALRFSPPWSPGTPESDPRFALVCLSRAKHLSTCWPPAWDQESLNSLAEGIPSARSLFEEFLAEAPSQLKMMLLGA